MTRAAIAMDGNVISEHFGKTKSFLFVNYEGDHLLSREVIAAPTEEHVPGLFPKWIKEMGPTELSPEAWDPRPRDFLNPSASMFSP